MNCNNNDSERNRAGDTKGGEDLTLQKSDPGDSQDAGERKDTGTRDESGAAGTPYDIAWRTIVQEAPRLLIPFINKVFGTEYSRDAQVTLSQTEVITQSAESSRRVRRAMDSHFFVSEPCQERKDQFHLEVESGGGTGIVSRLWKYDAAVAIAEKSEHSDVVDITMPSTAVVFLRPGKGRAGKGKLRFGMLDEELRRQSYTHHIPYTSTADYSLDDIFDNDLLAMLPFYIFQYESQFSEIEADENRLAGLRETFGDIRARLDKAQECGKVTAYERHMLLEVISSVSDALTRQHKKIREEIRSMLNAPVVEFEAKAIRDEGIAIGKKSGIAIGKKSGIAIGKKSGIAIGERSGGIRQLIKTYRKFKASDADILSALQSEFDMSPDEAARELQQYKE